MAQRWTAVLARLGMPTGDGRILAPGGITNRDLPLPLMWQRSTGDGHGGAEVVGRIEEIQYGADSVTATGSLLDSAPDDVRELISSGVTGPSVDLDDIDYVMDDQERIIVTQGRIAGATLVPIPAFADVSIHMDQTPVAMVASVRTSGWSDMPIADEGTAWDGSAASGRIFDWATDGDTTDWSRYARGFLQKKDGVDPETKGAYGYGIADIVNGTLTIIPRGVFAAAAAVQGARGASAGADTAGMKRVLSGIYSRMDREAPFSADVVTASAAQRPPLDWFKNPQLDDATPLTVTPEGRVYGHVAVWGTCHVGLPGCVTPPSSNTEYAHFLVGAELTQEGVQVPVGKLTVGGGHATPDAGYQAAAAHYDDVSTAVASVFAGEDGHGIWVAGYVIPGTPQEKVDELLRSPLSGDWRRIGGNLEMIAAHAVNVPGFPIPRAKVKFSLGHQVSLVGNFSVKPGAAPKKQGDNGSEARAAWAKSQWKGRE